MSTFESIAWGLNLSPVTWDTFLAYITNGKTDFRHCVIGNLDLRGLPLNLAETALRVQTECVKTIDLYQARQIYVTEESPSLQRLREIAQDLLSTSQLNIEDSLPLADPSDWTAFDFFAVFRYCNTRINTLNHFFAQACLENGYTKKYLTFGVVPGMSSEDYSCLAYALQTGRYNTLLTIELCQKYLNTAQVQILADALGSGRCQEGLFVCLKRAVLKARHVQIMMSAVMNGHFPEQGGIEFDFTRSKNPLDTRQASLTHIAEMLESGKCPEGFRLTLSGADFAGQNAIIPLCRALNSGRFARNVCIDLAGSRTDEFTLIDLVSALERGPRPVGLDIRLNPDQGEHGRVKTLMSRLHSLLTETVLDMGPTPDNAPASNTPGENPRDAGDEKEDFSLSWCEFFSSPKHKTQRPSSENSSDISFSLD